MPVKVTIELPPNAAEHILNHQEEFIEFMRQNGFNVTSVKRSILPGSQCDFPNCVKPALVQTEDKAFCPDHYLEVQLQKGKRYE